MQFIRKNKLTQTHLPAKETDGTMVVKNQNKSMQVYKDAPNTTPFSIRYAKKPLPFETTTISELYLLPEYSISKH